MELFDQESLRLKQVTGIDIQDMKDDMLRHRLIMHASRLDTFSKVREVQDVARAREAAGGVVSIQIGAVKTRVIVARKASSCKLTRREMTRSSWQRRTSTSSASTAKKQGHVKRDCRNHEHDIKKAKESGASFVDRKQTAENHGR